LKSCASETLEVASHCGLASLPKFIDPLSCIYYLYV
jgi:hypothetical protein